MRFKEFSKKYWFIFVIIIVMIIAIFLFLPTQMYNCNQDFDCKRVELCECKCINKNLEWFYQLTTQPCLYGLCYGDCVCQNNKCTLTNYP